MLAAILFVIVILAAAAVLVFRFLGVDDPKESVRYVEDSVRAWRNDELDRGQFEVKVEPTRASDVFTTFEKVQGDGYISLEEVGDTIMLPEIKAFAKKERAAREAKQRDAQRKSAKKTSSV
ncbi:MAG: hypothetical protein PUK40_07720 [Actinomycetaceae bacterium]|nr:hypothetical protein [Arcanobacterium sp.]MDD7505809.1 hypothetical protein [Actinomycetaceae bacterium]MDY6142880.1 hypothetical protein [Arcanobacterium sp.]